MDNYIELECLKCKKEGQSYPQYVESECDCAICPVCKTKYKINVLNEPEFGWRIELDFKD